MDTKKHYCTPVLAAHGRVADETKNQSIPTADREPVQGMFYLATEL